MLSDTFLSREEVADLTGYQQRRAQALGGHATEAMTLRYIRDRATVVAMGPVSIRKRKEGTK